MTILLRWERGGLCLFKKIIRKRLWDAALH